MKKNSCFKLRYSSLFQVEGVYSTHKNRKKNIPLVEEEEPVKNGESWGVW
jgi:hypothetical protein